MPERPMGIRTFTCPQCGATQHFDPATRTLSCPFCGTNLELDPAPAAPVDSVPAELRDIVPFAIAHADALARLRTWLGKAFWSPNDLASRAAVDVTAGIYVPHYGFILDVHANWTGAYAQTHYRTEVSTTTDANGNTQVRSRQVPYTVWYPESGQHDGTYATLVCASRGLTQREADALLPFDVDAARPDRSDYLAGFSTELPRFPVAEAWRSAGNERIDAQVRSACAAMTGQLRTYHWVTEQASETLLWLPVWIYRYRYGEQFHRVVMNGQTGKVSGDRPVSPRKVGVAVLAVLIAAVILFTALHVRSAQAASATAANAPSFATEAAQPTATQYPHQQTATANVLHLVATSTAYVGSPMRTP
jgi:uncharacterized protein (DUF983 family)